MHADYQLHGDVALITLNNPPVNGLGYETRVALMGALSKALADAAVQAIVITGAGKSFCGGADIREFDTPAAFQEPNLHTVIAALEQSTKPVVAAIHGTVMGGGLELALACHYRVAAQGTQVALPEVKLGLLPGAGGTQRLPRVIGVEPALNMIVSGEAVASERLAAIPGQSLFQRLSASADALLDEALAFARTVAAVRPLPLVRALPCSHPQGDAYFQCARNMLGPSTKNLPAPLQCVDAVQAATRQAFDAGLATEQAIFARLMATPQSRALRHLFFGERAASKIPDLPPNTALRPVASVAIIGAGTMGSGIAMNFLNAGIPVQMLELQFEALERGVATMRRNYEAQVSKGKLKPEALEQRMALLRTTLRYEDLAQADLVIEAVFEDMGVKATVFQELDRVMKPGAILASNTSTLDLNQIAACTQRPQDVVGLHFFSPANVMKLLEVVRGAKTAPDVLATVMVLAKKIRKTAVVSGVCDGFIGNRMLAQYRAAANELMVQGALPQQIDGAIQAFGFAMGPFRVADLAGLDISWAGRKRRAAASPTPVAPIVDDWICEAGRFGQKTGAGWYRYEAGKRDAIPDPIVEAMIDKYRLENGIKPRKIEDSEIIERCMFALVNEAARILEERTAARASDVDIVYLNGYGFPAHVGGPMHYANTVGLPKVLQRLKDFAAEPGANPKWQPAALIVRLVERETGFN